MAVLTLHSKKAPFDPLPLRGTTAYVLRSFSQVQGTFSVAGYLLDLSIHPAVLGGSLRFCEQPATRLINDLKESRAAI